MSLLFTLDTHAGVLDKPLEKVVDKAAPQQPKGPAWGGVGPQQQQQLPQVPGSSLRDVLSQEQQQAAARPPSASAGATKSGASGMVRQASQLCAGANSSVATAAAVPAVGKPLSLAEFIPTSGSAKAKRKAKAQEEAAAAAKGPAWGASAPVLGSSPPAQLSLKDIQAEQARRRVQQRVVTTVAASATARTAGTSGSNVVAVARVAAAIHVPNASPVVVPVRAGACSTAQVVYGSSPPSGASPPTSK